MAVIYIDLMPLWHNKEREIGRDLSIRDVAEATGLDWKTVDNLKKGRTTRIDLPKIALVCKYLGVPDGVPVPFLIFRSNNGSG